MPVPEWKKSRVRVETCAFHAGKRAPCGTKRATQGKEVLQVPSRATQSVRHERGRAERFVTLRDYRPNTFATLRRASVISFQRERPARREASPGEQRAITSARSRTL